MSAAEEQITSETAAELLRLALPLMSRHKVPATPPNYAIWYEYVRGENLELKDEVDRLIREGAAFTRDVNKRLYLRFVVGQEINNVETVRAELTKILGEVGSSLDEAGANADSFQGRLGGFATEMAEKDDLADIRSMLQTLISETQEMRSVTSSMQMRFEGKSEEIRELQEQLEQERRRAITDPLTGLYNRLALLEQLSRVVAGAPEQGPPSLIMFDIDHFKSVNDTHGHLIGDRVIRFVAQLLTKNTKGKDVAARYGGEEFIVLLPDTPLEGATAVAETIRKAVAGAQLVRADNKKPLGQITISAGVTSYRSGEDQLEFLDRADQALYQSKNNGRNQVTTE